MTEDRTLLDAVDDLTLVQISRETIGGKTVSVTGDPLLQQLTEAITASMGGTMAGARSPNEAVPLNMDALQKFMQIASQIRDWCRMLKVPVRKDLVQDLRAWYVAYNATQREVEVDAFYLRQLGKWAGMIRSTMRPFRESDLPQACPSCGAAEWWRDGERYYRPLVLRYRAFAESGERYNEHELVDHAHATCRACEKVWPQVRELAYELETQEEETTAS